MPGARTTSGPLTATPQARADSRPEAAPAKTPAAWRASASEAVSPLCARVPGRRWIFDGRTCLVTGSNRGIGRAIAVRLAQEAVRLLAGVRELDCHQALAPDDDHRPAQVKPVRMDCPRTSPSSAR